MGGMTHLWQSTLYIKSINVDNKTTKNHFYYFTILGYLRCIMKRSYCNLYSMQLIQIF